MSRAIHLELTPPYITNYILMHIEPEEYNDSLYKNEDDGGDYWKNWNQTQKLIPRD